MAMKGTVKYAGYKGGKKMKGLRNKRSKKLSARREELAKRDRNRSKKRRQKPTKSYRDFD
jgi:transposase